MLYLWIFGNNIEDALGHIRFLIFYVLTGIAAGAAHIVTEPQSSMPMIGASGAISGILGAYIVLYPKAEIQTLMIFGWFWRVIEVRAIYFLGFWFILQLIQSSMTKAGGGGVAWMAHIGGFVAGALLIKLFAPARRRRGYDEDN
jgi:membrane associated rhomboid family serine protease